MNSLNIRYLQIKMVTNVSKVIKYFLKNILYIQHLCKDYSITRDLPNFKSSDQFDSSISELTLQ